MFVFTVTYNDNEFETKENFFSLQEEVYSLDSSKQFLDKDVVQLHSTRYQPLRKVRGHDMLDIILFESIQEYQ